MRKMCLLLSAALLGCSASAFAGPDPEQLKSVEGINAIEAHWSQAFVTGDAAYLDGLLADDYVSVNAKGVARPKAEVIALAKRYAAGNPAPLPPRDPSPVSIEGDAAIVRHRSPQDVSIDVFYWRDGAWHAWYSQHLAPPRGG
jgi:hypothetical protein